MFSFGGNAGTSYPAGANPWNTQPVQTSPGYTYFTPGQTPAAEEMNYIFASMSAASGSNVSVPGIGWQPLASLATGPAYPTGGRWDSVTNNRWLMCGNTSGGPTSNVYTYQGQGDSTDTGVFVDNSGGLNFYPTDAIWDGTHFFAGGTTGTGTSYIYRCLPGGAWSAVLTLAAGGGNLFGPVNFLISGGFMYAFIAENTNMNVYYAAVGGGASWTGPVGVAVNSGGYLSAATNGTNFVAFPNFGGPTFYMESVAPQTTWASQSAAFLTHGSEGPYGLVWSPADALFVLVTAGGDSKMHTYVSPTGIAGTWTEQGTGVAAIGTSVRNLAVTGQGCLSAIVAGGASPDYTIYSVDAGANWRMTPNQLPVTAHTITGLLNQKIAASPFGFMATNMGSARFSRAAGLTAPLV